MQTTELGGKTILVTGASGFIGSQLCRQLLAQGVEVHAVSRSDRSSDVKGLRWWKAALADFTTARRLIADLHPDAIYHLAGHVYAARGLDMILPSLHGNLVTTVNVLTAATELGCGRIVLAGSMEEPDRSDAMATPSSPYAAAKWAASGYARMFRELYGAPIVNLRVSMVYGPGKQDLRKLIPYVTLALLRNQPPKLSSGKRPIDWIYLDDVVDGLVAAAQAPNVAGCTIDLGSGRPATVREVVLQLTRFIPTQTQPLFSDSRDRALEQVYVANIADAYAKLNWRPKVSLEEGLRRTVDWYAQRLRTGEIPD